MFDYIIVGSGIGGTVSYSILKKLNKKVTLFEKENYLGGCSGTFKRDTLLYNVGASTLVGLDESMPLGKVFNFLQIEKPKSKKLEIPIIVYVGNKIIYRYTNREKSVYEIEDKFKIKDIKKVWNKVFEISDLNWSNIYNLIPLNIKNIKLSIKQILKNRNYILKTLPYNFTSSYKFFKNNIGYISKDFKDFLDNQILMTSQGYSNDVSINVGSMGLTYPNLDNYYVFGGMEKIFECLTGDKENIFLRCKVLKIKKIKDYFKVYTTCGEYEAKKVILNKTIWDYCNIVENSNVCDLNIKNYSKIWSAITLYFHIEDKYNTLKHHHYQIVHSDINPYTGSNSFFISISDVEDNTLTADGWKSVTISTHCKIEKWSNLKKEEYKEQKEKVKDFILNKLYTYIPEFRFFKKSNIMIGTPKTFERFTGRYNGTVGGIPLIMDYVPFKYPYNFTNIEGLYLVGDSVFPGQGWPGVVIGVLNLLYQIEDLNGILH